VAQRVDQQAVLSNVDFLNVHDPAQRGQNGDFVVQVAQFTHSDRLEAVVPERGHHSHLAHGEI